MGRLPGVSRDHRRVRDSRLGYGWKNLEGASSRTALDRPHDVGRIARALIHWVRDWEPGRTALPDGITWLTPAPEDRPAGGLIREAAPAPYSTTLKRIGIELPSIV
jgi:hypothetical protein